jgi:two-component system phosphate regulon response regulator PhoB
MWRIFCESRPTLLQALRNTQRGNEVPVIMLSAFGSEEDRIEGLQAGADDYLPKPFSPKELLARIKAVLRRRTPQLAEAVVAVHGLTMDPTSHRVYVVKDRAEIPLKVGPTEFKLLHYFLTHPERVHSRAMLLDQVWGDHAFIEERTVDVHIKRLRTVLKSAGYESIIETVRGSGYRLSAQGMIEAVKQAEKASLLRGRASTEPALSP